MKQQPILVEIVITRWKDPVTGKFVKNPHPTLKNEVRRKGEVKEEIPLGDGEYAKVYFRYKLNRYGYQVPSSCRVVWPSVREAVSRGEISVDDCKRIERDLADEILKDEKIRANRIMEKELMQEGYNSDKAKRAAATRKANKARKGKAPAPSEAQIKADFLEAQNKLEKAKRANPKTAKSKQIQQKKIQSASQKMATVKATAKRHKVSL
ncbi:hypothetical protein [Deinococcus cellulosilyticus]|uniref:Uncharacterized protein n=1 Tax=Deinococcus cellulosilyticus (strain DSM 18568 / NBRC 106333 / KACC 11606 / 5516J-15) TaxID=1223518 RepID=A0A511MYR4_DEIC1|nr:hypothetical protein [Deinococcus cellulosilyticus]GEM45296.1 hypothetical protein DC3_09310 [Deinococcus cellulosilyticus NBRC 106333 = KACC 11606]